MKLVFLGPPGAGKGTQAARMAAEFKVEHASTGDIFREAVRSGSELGRTVRDFLDGGKLVPDELTSRVVEEMVVERFEDYILDGYPRTIGQADDLQAMLEKRGLALDGVLHFELDDETAVRRLTGRLVCKQCGANYHREFMPPAEQGICDLCGATLQVRSDSALEVVRERLTEYGQKTQPLVPYYRERGLLQIIDAAQAPEDVEADTVAVLQRMAGH